MTANCFHFYFYHFCCCFKFIRQSIYFKFSYRRSLPFEFWFDEKNDISVNKNNR